MLVKVCLKPKSSIINFFKETNSDIKDKDNVFYISKGSSQITINGYCEEERVFTCIEYPEHVFPVEFLSHEVNNRAIDEEFNFSEIGSLQNMHKETARKYLIKALDKMYDLMKDNSELKGYIYG